MSPPLQLPLLPPGLQQMQQLLQSSPLAGLNPAQLQTLLVQQNRDNAAAADSGRKQLEQLIPQLQAGWTGSNICFKIFSVNIWDFKIFSKSDNKVSLSNH